MEDRGKGRGRSRLSLAGPVSLTEHGGAEIDWELCIFCQKTSSEKVECPALNPIISRRNAGYISIATKMEKLAKYDYVFPSMFRVQKVDSGTGYEATLSTNKAKWHKTCINAYRDNTKFQTLLKRLEEERDQVKDAEEQEECPHPLSSASRQTRSAGVGPLHLKGQICFLCKSTDIPENLHLCSTKEVHQNIAQSAAKVGDAELTALLATADVIALEAKFHLKCLTKLYNKARRVDKKATVDQGDVICEGIAFSDLAVFIHRKAEEGKAMKLADLVAMYQDRLAQLLGVAPGDLPYVHSTRFKEKIQAHFPSLRADKEGRDVVLRHMSTSILHNIHDEDQDDDALAFQRFVKTLRRTVFETPAFFKGELTQAQQKKCIPSALLAALNLLMYGSTVAPSNQATQPAISIAQLVMLNMQKRVPKGDIVRNKRELEAPVPLYLALSTYGRSRSRKAIDEMHSLGVSVSSDRVMEVTSDLCHLVTERAKEEGILCPLNLEEMRFTVLAYDNIDHNPSSRTSKGSFHGTSMSVFQTGSVAGLRRTLQTTYTDVAAKGRRSVPLLPDFYAHIPEIKLHSKQPLVPLRGPDTAAEIKSLAGNLNVLELESDWLQHVREKMEEGNESQAMNVSWAAFYASKETSAPLCATNALLPLFEENSESEDMMHHGMNLSRLIVNHLNPGQVPVLCVDQPLYKLARLVQWNFPNDELRENNFFVLMGPFHIEKAFLSVIGQFAENSGWKSIYSGCGLMTESAAESILKASNVTKSRAAFQVTAAALHALLIDAYEMAEEDQTLEEWVRDCAAKYPTFNYWLTLLELILLLLQFVKSLRSGKFPLYVDSFGKMLPWFFFFNHTNYARWGTVHYLELVELPKKIPSLYDEFMKGKFVVHKSTRAMSALGIDQAHEQNNRVVKEDGGAIGLTENPTALRRWMLGGPEVTRLLLEFRGEADDEEDLLGHHEQYHAFQADFVAKCAVLKEGFATFSNPFLERLENLLALDTRLFSTKEGQESLLNCKQAGTAIFHRFIDERMCSDTKGIFDTIPKNKCQIFSSESNKKPSTDKVKELKSDMQLFAKLYLNIKTLNLDKNEFFRHENQSFPPALSVNGRMRSGDKSDLLSKLLPLVPKAVTTGSVDCIVVDGAAVVNYLPPRKARTFKQYAEEEFLGYITSQCSILNAGRVDVVWDQYHEISLKHSTRDDRGAGIRRQVLPRAALPSNWPVFLRHSKNKEELFALLAEALVSFTSAESKLKVLSNVKDVIRGNPHVTSRLIGVSCASMEEADGRIILHVADMVNSGAKDVLIRTVDTDVAVLAISFYQKLHEQGLASLWVKMGTGANVKYLPAHDIAMTLGEEKAVALRGFHAFTGCDEVSYMASKGKKTAWNAWKSNPEVTTAFTELSHPRAVLSDNTFALLQVFVIRMYDAKSTRTDVDDARQDLYDGVKTLTVIPPTKGALLQHSRRAAFTAGQTWGQADQPQPIIDTPSNWGWKLDDNWRPIWSELPDVWEKCQLKKKCHCKKQCKASRCPCRIAVTPCKVDCRCKGTCADPAPSILQEHAVDDVELLEDENGFPL